MIIADFDKFMQDTNIYPMNNDSLALGKLEGKYTIILDETECEFTDARLAPPVGNVSTNYARYMFILHAYSYCLPSTAKSNTS